MRTYILLLSIIFMTGCVSSTQNTSTSSPVKSISSHTGIDGLWKGRFEVGGERRYRSVSFEFNKIGDTVTGVCIWGSNSTPLLDGKITGNKITFRTVATQYATTVKTYYQGEFNGDELKLASRFNAGADGSGNVKGVFRRVN